MHGGVEMRSVIIHPGQMKLLNNRSARKFISPESGKAIIRTFPEE
jgi:hypothetical protein